VSRRSAVEAVARRAVLALGDRTRHGTIVLHEGGTETVLGVGEPIVDVTVHDPRAYAALRAGSRGLGESYRQGWWDTDDLTGLLQVLFRNLAGPLAHLDRLGARLRPLLDPPARLRRPDKARDRRNIRAHYDIGNDFYALMLDPTMTYSCAVFERPDVTLEQAQTEKLDRICRRLALSPDDHVLEIGCGWGSFALHAASRYGCRVTTTTISAAQHDLASKRVAEAGLADRVTVLDADYRDLTGTYDKLVSIEMIEAVDWREHDRFFATCADRLRPEGLALLQAIVIADASFERAKRHDDFIRTSIFPGGCLPSITSITASAQRAGLRVVGLDDIGVHYAETLRRWRARVHEHEDEAAELGLGAEFLREWDLFLTYCEAAFLVRHVSDVHVVLAAPAWRGSLGLSQP
jgi:cyclopropane-fatty-acyl-phospholipid synthase